MQRLTAITSKIRPTLFKVFARDPQRPIIQSVIDKGNSRNTLATMCKLQTHKISAQFSTGRVLSSYPNDKDVKKAIESLTDKFMEARELLDDARESEGTVYFSDDMDEAQEAVKDTVEMYTSLLKELSEQQRQEVVRTIGLKMEELKAQLQAIEQDLKDSH